MSLKSFDEFCAKMVNNEPIKQKEIFDERQKLIRNRITFNSVLLFARLSAVNTIIMDWGLQWCGMYFAPMILFYVISYIYWIIANACKGSLFGVGGTKFVKSNAFIMIFISIVDLLNLLVRSFDEEFSVIKNGMLSVRFIGVIAFSLLLIAGIAAIVLAHRYDKAQKEQPEK